MGNAILKCLRGDRDDVQPPHRPQYELQAGTLDWPQGVQFEIYTLPVKAELIGDGDGMTVDVDTALLRESSQVPKEVREAAIERRKYRADKKYTMADSFLEKIKYAGYWMVKGRNNEETLAKVYKIRLKGIDAPEMDMEYGQEAKDALIKLIQNKPLKIQIYKKDSFDRWLGDVYCDGVFIQEILLKEGCAWHFRSDKRPKFAQWMEEARNARKGLWENPNPVPPWKHKREKRQKFSKNVKSQKLV